MTAQLTEILYYKDKYHSLCTLPLDSHTNIAQIRASFHGVHSHTACERRYVGIWKVIENRLYLEAMETVRGENLAVKEFFEGQEFPVFAHWFSGELRCPKGELLKYIHFDFKCIYERELIITVKSGVIESDRLITNEPPPPRDRREALDIPEFLLRK
ncbi:hypothetical protein GCM10027343_16780 [Noviherbaspirillum agri]